MCTNIYSNNHSNDDDDDNNNDLYLYSYRFYDINRKPLGLIMTCSNPPDTISWTTS